MATDSRKDALVQTAHPSQIGLEDFGAYALVIDGRGESQFAADHVPGAVSVPLGGWKSGDELPSRLSALITALPAGSFVLLYAGKGEQALNVWAAALRERGLAVDVLAGGWGSYRRWVEAALEVLPRMFALQQVVVAGDDDATHLIEAIENHGQQVLDLTASDWTPPSAGALDSWLVDTLRHRETDRCLWVFLRGDAELPLPPSMKEALSRVAPIHVALSGLDPANVAAQAELLVRRFVPQIKP